MEKEIKQECSNNENKECSHGNIEGDNIKESSQCGECGLCKLVPNKIPMYAPYTVRNLEPETTYYYCTCGLTTGQQPLCDQKSCIGTKFTPKEFQIKKKQTLQLLCGCRYSSNIPFCDGYHTNMPFNPTNPPCKCDNEKKETCKKLDW